MIHTGYLSPGAQWVIYSASCATRAPRNGRAKEVPIFPYRAVLTSPGVLPWRRCCTLFGMAATWSPILRHGKGWGGCRGAHGWALCPGQCKIHANIVRILHCPGQHKALLCRLNSVLVVTVINRQCKCPPSVVPSFLWALTNNPWPITIKSVNNSSCVSWYCH